MAVMAASPSPRTAARSRRHPPYKEMIVSAIQSLKERTGSSRTAIAKYILSNYSDLPPKHDALLAHHLHRLKASGLLRMVYHSYKLSPSASRDSKPRGRPPKAVPLSEKRKPGRPKKVSAGLVPLVLDSKKSKPGRPRKVQLAVELILPKGMKPVLDPNPAGLKRKPGRPPKTKTLSEKWKPGRHKMVSAVLVPLVLDSSNRKPGRPRKDPLAVELVLPKGMKPVLDTKSTALIPSGEKRKPGRPAKTTPLSDKKKPGRPKKIAAKLAQLGSPFPRVFYSNQRKPGRPRKDPSASLPAELILPKGEKRKRGRPKKGSLPISSVNVVVGGGGSMPKTVDSLVVAATASVEKRKQGRPPNQRNLAVPAEKVGSD